MSSTTSYDTIEYPGHAFQQTHPARLAAVGRLYGIPTVSPRKCRILEVGAGDGGNLIPMAMAYPESECIGFDLAPTAVDKGNAAIAALGLKNCQLHVADICQVGDRYGQFDYIMAHGVFSWVPEFVRIALLDLYRRSLTPRGIAYVSYNAMPGCRIRQVFWDIARFHTRSVDDPATKIEQTREVFSFLAEGIPERNALREYMREEARELAEETHQAILYHDTLAEPNQPYFFHEFAALARDHHLQFLSEAVISDMENEVFPQPIVDRLLALRKQDVVLEEQYRDFLKLRRFRQTLLIHENVPVQRELDASRLEGLHLGIFNPTEETDLDLTPGKAVRFSVKAGSGLTVEPVLAKAALSVLAGLRPHTLTLEELLQRANQKLGRTDPPSAAERTEAMDALLAAIRVGIVFALVDPPSAAQSPGERPRLCALVRQQIETGADALTSRLHSPVRIDDLLTRRLLWLMDGTRDQAAIAGELAAWSAAQNPGQDVHALRAQYLTLMPAGFAKATELALLVEQ